MDKKATKEEALCALAYLEVVAMNNSENEKFVKATKTVRERLVHLESCFDTIRDWMGQME